MDDLQIVRAGKKHSYLMAEFRFKMFQDMFEKEDYTTIKDSFISDCLDYYQKHIENEDNANLIAYSDEKAVGCAAIQIQDRPPHIKFGVNFNGYILTVYVEKEFRNRGIARRLMERLCLVAKEKGVRRLGLHASQFGRPLYEKMGYKLSEKYMEMEI